MKPRHHGSRLNRPRNDEAFGRYIREDGNTFNTSRGSIVLLHLRAKDDVASFRTLALTLREIYRTSCTSYIEVRL